MVTVAGVERRYLLARTDPNRPVVVFLHGAGGTAAWADGETGAISQQYQVESIPTIFVLDHEGVIRFKDVRGADLEKAVEELMAKVPSPADPSTAAADGSAPSSTTEDAAAPASDPSDPAPPPSE